MAAHFRLDRFQTHIARGFGGEALRKIHLFNERGIRSPGGIHADGEEK